MKTIFRALWNDRGIALRWFLVLLLVCPATPVRSDEQAAVTSTRDATINQATPAVNNGAATTVSTHTSAGANQRALVRFDLSASGLNSTTAVKTSTLNLIPTSPMFSGRSQEVHRITGAIDWTEAGVTWNKQTGGVTNWTAAGGDFDPTATDTQSSGATAGTAVPFNVLSDSTSANIPQGWINGTIPNFGLVIKDQSENGAAWQYQRQITVTTGAVMPFNGYSGYSAQITGLDTATLVGAGKMRSDCNDLRIARFSANTWTELDRQILNCNTANTTVWFKLQANIAASSTDTSYYLNYGSSTAAAGPANLNNVYLFYDNFAADTVGQLPAGWTVQSGTAWTVQSDATGNFLRWPSNGPAAPLRTLIKVTSITTEQDVFVQAGIRQTDANATEITGCTAGRFNGSSDANVNLYKSCITNFGGGRSGMIVSYVAGTTTTHQATAFAWTDNTFTTVAGAMFGSPATVRNYVNGALQVTLTNNGDLNAVSGSVGVVGIVNNGTNYDFNNFLARRYTEPEPVLTLAAEANPSLPLWGSRENIAANQPTLNVHYLRDVTLSAATVGISEITENWAFPTGSTSANYDGVLFAKQAGGSAPVFTPADGTSYVVGAQPVAGVSVAANTGAFGTVSALDENGDNSVVLPGTLYSYKAYTHDATAIPGAASTVAPHYAFGNTATQSVATTVGGGTKKRWSYKTAATTLAAPALDPGVAVVTGGNDNIIHSMSATTGGRNYQPGGAIGTTGGTIQTRPSLIAAADTSQPTCKNVCDVVYAAAGDGKVYAFRADTGALLWQSAVLTTGAGSGLQGAPAVQVKSFAGVGYTLAFDLVIVGTRNVGSATNNKIYGLNGNTGATVWTANTGNLDIVNSTPMLDYTNNMVWVTSRSNSGAQGSLWKISTNTGTVSASFSLGDSDQAASLDTDGRAIYVLTNGGLLYAVRTDLANCSTSFTLPAGTVPVGFPMPVLTTSFNDDVYFSATTAGVGSVQKVHFGYILATCGGTFTSSSGGWVNPAITSPSALIYAPPPMTPALYVGSSDGKLYKINLTNGTILGNVTVNLGATIGDPSFDTVSQKFYAGDSTGRVYSFDSF
jgi:outer membrane protein assembly factor BamB